MVRFFVVLYALCTTMFILQNKSVSGCTTCGFNSILKFVNTTIIQTKSVHFKFHKISMKVSNPKTIKLVIPDSCVLPPTIHTTDDLLALFTSMQSLNRLSPTEKQWAVEMLVSHYGWSTAPLAAGVTVNLVTVFGRCNQLLAELPTPVFRAVLTMVAANKCALSTVSRADLAAFARGLFAMSPGVLVTVPRPTLVSVFGAVCTADVLDGLPSREAINVVTVLSLSRPVFTCMPPSALTGLLTFVAARPVVLSALPMSTLFGFVEGLLDSINDPSYIAADTVPVVAFACTIGPLMTSKMLSVFPAHVFDLLVAVLGSSASLSAGLSPSQFNSMFIVMAKSPTLLTSLSPNRVANLLVTISTCPSIFNGVPHTVWYNLLDSLNVYLPASLSCFPAQAFWSTNTTKTID